jgi:hypothetical protein
VAFKTYNFPTESPVADTDLAFRNNKEAVFPIFPVVEGDGLVIEDCLA